MAPSTMAGASPESSQFQSAPHPNLDREGEAVRVVRSEEHYAGRRVVLIQHCAEQYRLLVTRNDRLTRQQ